jgi:hypothetical protein
MRPVIDSIPDWLKEMAASLGLELANQYVARLDALLKLSAWFEQSAHFAFFEEPAKFTAEMLRIQKLVTDFWRNR